MVCQFVVICRQAASRQLGSCTALHRAVRTDIKKVNLGVLFLRVGCMWDARFLFGGACACVTAHEPPSFLPPNPQEPNVWSALGSTKA